jgi:hypothetical protein
MMQVNEARDRVDEIRRLAEEGSLIEADNARFALFLATIREVHARLHASGSLPVLQQIIDIVMEVE